MHEGHGCSYTVKQHQELYRSLTTPPLAQCQPLASEASAWQHLCCSFAIYLMVSVRAPGSRWQWEVQNSFLAPPGSVGGVLYILHVWSHLVYASVSGTYTPEQWEQQTHPASSPKTTFPTIYLGQLFSLQKCPTINREIGAKAG